MRSGGRDLLLILTSGDGGELRPASSSQRWRMAGLPSSSTTARGGAVLLQRRHTATYLSLPVQTELLR